MLLVEVGGGELEEEELENIYFKSISSKLLAEICEVSYLRIGKDDYPMPPLETQQGDKKQLKT